MLKIRSSFPSNIFAPLSGPSTKQGLQNRFIAWTQKYIEYKRDQIKEKMNNSNIIKIDFESIKDERGEIRRIAQNVDVLRITSVKGSKRASHRHLHSSHLCVLLSGSMTYYEKPVGQNIKPIKLKINPGDYFYTGKQIDHLMLFDEDSVFDCYSYGSRNQESYENDLIRLDYDLENMYNKWRD